MVDPLKKRKLGLSMPSHRAEEIGRAPRVQAVAVGPVPAVQTEVAGLALAAADDPIPEARVEGVDSATLIFRYQIHKPDEAVVSSGCFFCCVF